MGKKHKKKSKTDKTEIEDAPSPAPSSIASTTVSEPPLKLVLKVGGSKSQVGNSESYNIQENTASDTSTPQRDQHVKKKKKKKKKSSDKEKEKFQEKSATKREYESYESHETNSQEDEFSRDETTMDEDNLDETLDRTEEDMETEDLNPPKAKKALLVTQDDSEKQKEKQSTPANRPVRDKDAVHEKKPLQKVLDNLQRTLQKKDVDCFFAWPVNDVIAPGYSSIISTPMDFSTMKKKIDTNEYQSLDEYRNDFNLMCNNATIYNGADTIYHKAAKKLLMTGAKIMKKERLLTLKRAYGYYEEGDAKLKSRRKKVVEGDTATEDSSGIDGEAMEIDSESIRDQGGRDSELNLEEDTAEEILDQVLQAAKDAKERLTARRPGSKIGFLRRDKSSGTTTLNILNPDRAGQQDSREVKLGLLTARLTHGTGSVPGFKEDKRNKVTPVSYLNYGAYSSFAPTFDSTYSNISKEESDLLYATYGDKSAYQYAQSIQDYVKDCGDYAVNLVDNILDVMTNGDHSKAKKALDKKRKEDEQKKKDSGDKDKSGKGKDQDVGEKGTKQASDGGDKKEEFDFDSLKSLSDLGIDMSFLPTIEKEIKKQKNNPSIKQEPSEAETKLNDTSALIGDLEKTQNERMSQKPPPHLSFTPGPSDQECEIAEKITQQLLALTSKVAPGDVAPSAGVRKAMGIELQPSISPALPQEEPAVGDDPLDQMPAPGDVDKELMDLLEGSGSKS